MTSSFTFLGDLQLILKDHGQKIDDECNKCMILAIFNAMELNVTKHFKIIVSAARDTEDKYNKSLKINDNRGQIIQMHHSLKSLLTYDSMLDISVFQMIEWHTDWTKFMMVVISSAINRKAPEVNVFYHHHEGNQISAKKIIFLHLHNSHFQEAKNIGALHTTVVDLLLILKNEEDKGCIVSVFNCASNGIQPLPFLASLNGRRESTNELKEFIKTVHEQVENKS
jgi:hypothetical protein